MGKQLFINNGSSTLAGTLAIAATTLTVAASAGDNFPVVDGGDADEFCLITIEDTAGNIEIVKCTSRVGGADVMTIVRAQEGTSDQAFVAGDRVELRVTKGTLEAFVLRDNDVIHGGVF